MLADDGTLSFSLKALCDLELRLRAMHWTALTRGDLTTQRRLERAADGDVASLIVALAAVHQPTIASADEDTVPNRVATTREMSVPARISDTPVRSAQRRRTVDR